VRVRGVAQSKNVIFWGAGATKSLGIRTTADQERFIRCITAPHNSRESLKKRIAAALGPKITKPWHDALFDLITILGDSDESYDSINAISREQLKAMRRNWHRGAGTDELRQRILDLV
jgi:hypothetical protein